MLSGVVIAFAGAVWSDAMGNLPAEQPSRNGRGKDFDRAGEDVVAGEACEAMGKREC
jgi:hypothetical protein